MKNYPASVVSGFGAAHSLFLNFLRDIQPDVHATTRNFGSAAVDRAYSPADRKVRVQWAAYCSGK